MKKQKLTILHLYPAEMNLYGDHGNVLVLQRRCEWRGIDAGVIDYEPGQKLPAKYDLIFGGGGQDSGQLKIASDLDMIAKDLKAKIEDGMPALVICGIYQLFGQSFSTAEQQQVPCANILDLETIGENERLIGNAVISSSRFGKIVGYENHSGRTYLGEGVRPLGKVLRGFGNNGKDQAEGAVWKNCIGTYLHGPLLPKNPRIADWLIEKALEYKYGEPVELTPLDDKIEHAAKNVAETKV